MSNYRDKFGMYHDKLVVDKEPSSNNAWICTAFAQKAKLPYSKVLVNHTFRKCKVRNTKFPNNLYLIRTPHKAAPPINREEILGMAALGFLKPHHLNGWSFSPYPIPKFSLIKTVNQLMEIKNKGKNYFWQNNMDQLYRFLFSIPIQDRHFILTKWGKFNILYWVVDKLDRLIKPKNGIDWLKYGGHTRKKVMQSQFPFDHPLRQL